MNEYNNENEDDIMIYEYETYLDEFELNHNYNNNLKTDDINNIKQNKKITCFKNYNYSCAMDSFYCTYFYFFFER